MTTLNETTAHTGLTPRRDYRGTLNITLNDKDPGAFPQRGNLPAREPEIQQRWEAADSIARAWRSRRRSARTCCTMGRPTPTATSIWATR